jgi:glyoxylate reductase
MNINNGAHKGRVLVTQAISETLLSTLRSRAEVTVLPGPGAPSAEQLIQEMPGHDVCICMLTDPINETVLRAAATHPDHPLRLIAQVAVGLDNIDLTAAKKLGVSVCHTPGVLTDATADLAFALLLASCRRIVEADRFVRDGNWTSWGLDLLTGVELRGGRLGIIGMGRIGTAVARRAMPFGMEIVYNNRRAVNDALEQELGAKRLTLNELLSSSDVVSLHAPLTPETEGMLGKEQLLSMKPGAVLVNTSRGGLIDETALAHALDEGPLRAVGLDVYQDEPQVHASLLHRKDVVLLPHIGSATEACRGLMAKMMVEASLACLDRAPLPYLAATS